LGKRCVVFIKMDIVCLNIKPSTKDLCFYEAYKITLDNKVLRFSKRGHRGCMDIDNMPQDTKVSKTWFNVTPSLMRRHNKDILVHKMVHSRVRLSRLAPFIGSMI
jgi:hypothetical protein